MICASCSHRKSCFGGIESAVSIPRVGYWFSRFSAKQLSTIPTGVYSICSDSQDTRTLLKFRLQGLDSFQVNYCYDQLPCQISSLKGNPLPTGGFLAVIHLNSTCADSLPSRVVSFPNEGLSQPALNGSYSFGSSIINTSTVPVQFKLCWISPSQDLRISVGTMIVQSFETFYRNFVITDQGWEPFDSSVKIFLLSFILVFAISAAFFIPIIEATYTARRKSRKPNEINTDNPIIARMCDDEVDEELVKSVETLLSVETDRVTNRVRIRQKRKELAHKIYCVSDL